MGFIHCEHPRVPPWLEPCAVFLFILANYLLSAPRGVVLDDDGYFILAAWYGGVAHPPGYPLYTLVANLFTHIPAGSVAFRVHMCSAVFGALACAVIWDLVRRVKGSRMAAWTGALGYGFSGTFWLQSTMAEVYSLNAFFFFVLLWLCAIPGKRASRGVWIAALSGLSLTNHWPLMLLSAPALALAAWPHRHALTRRPLPALTWFCIGLLPYAWMVYRSRVSEIAFFGPIESLSDFWFYVSREAYTSIDQSAAAGWMDKLRYATFSLTDAARQFGWVAAPFALVGLAAQWKVWPRSLCWALVAGFAGSTLVLAMLLGFDWDLMHRNVFAPYPLVAHGIFAVWVALGVTVMADWLARSFPAPARTRIVLPALALMAIGSVWLSNAPANYRPAAGWASEFATTLLESLKPNAVLIVSGDYAVGPVAYLNRIERLRPDVEVFNVAGQLFTNRVVSPRSTDPLAARAAFENFIAQEQRPIYYHLNLPHQRPVTLHGLFYEVARDLPAGDNKVILTPRIEQFFSRMFAQDEPKDLSELMHHRQLGAVYCRTLAALTEALENTKISTSLERNCAGYYGLLERATFLLAREHPDPTQALALLRLAGARQGEAVSMQSIAMLDNLFGLAYDQLGASDKASEHVRRSLARWPDSSNPAHAMMRAGQSGQ
ncbi:MAG: hypothetical protein A3H91_02855 [Gammaproteobacteria bacterium RIFCSPLOWO2_02_FULL_61_13]|nr:MAG: hypothetical protein A3H91_02855 [Gammaproteobacteria bacterium RIFCSPLOWO2_02_FULL_61_13]